MVECFPFTFCIVIARMWEWESRWIGSRLSIVGDVYPLCPFHTSHHMLFPALVNLVALLVFVTARPWSCDFSECRPAAVPLLDPPCPREALGGLSSPSSLQIEAECWGEGQTADQPGPAPSSLEQAPASMSLIPPSYQEGNGSCPWRGEDSAPACPHSAK